MHVRRETVAVTTDASGAATEYTDTVTGRVLGIRYVKGDFADGVDFTITSEATGETVWAESDVNASATRAPRQAIHGRSEEHTSELQSLMRISYAVFCLKKK